VLFGLVVDVVVDDRVVEVLVVVVVVDAAGVEVVVVGAGPGAVVVVSSTCALAAPAVSRQTASAPKQTPRLLRTPSS
jgi:hypothetical protein